MPQGNDHGQSRPLTGAGVTSPGCGHGLDPGAGNMGVSGHVRVFRPVIKGILAILTVRVP